MNFLLKLLDLLKQKPGGVSISTTPGTGYNADQKSVRTTDQSLSTHFSLFNLTCTYNTALQAANRTLSDSQVQKLEKLARHAEAIQTICQSSVNVHSGYRCDTLNGVTAGSSSTSQHPKCEAIDFDVPGQSVEETFEKLHNAAKAGKFQFGQLIIEQASRDYGVSKWVHCSVIGTLDTSKVGQVLKMVQGPTDPKPVYTLVEQLKFVPPNQIA